MTIAEAKDLISLAFPENKVLQNWADLGCGKGLFSQAISEFLEDESTIFAFDIEKQKIQSENNIHIKFSQKNIEKEELGVTGLDGIIMANSLHYIADKRNLIEKLKKNLKPTGKFILIEYDTKNANPWVPYPITRAESRKLFSETGFDKMQFLGERNSIYI